MNTNSRSAPVRCPPVRTIASNARLRGRMASSPSLSEFHTRMRMGYGTLTRSSASVSSSADSPARSMRSAKSSLPPYQ